MKRSKPTTLPLGTISEGTLRPEDLIPAYLSELQRLHLSRDERLTVNRIDREFQQLPSGDRWNGHGEPVIDWTDEQHEQAGYMVDELVEIIENHLPDYTYFGATEGDGACFGVWPDSELLIPGSRVDDVIKSEYSPSEWREAVGRPGQPADDHGCSHYLQVNDHGNVTLYRRAGNRWIEVWSVV